MPVSILKLRLIEYIECSNESDSEFLTFNGRKSRAEYTEYPSWPKLQAIANVIDLLFRLEYTLRMLILLLSSCLSSGTNWLYFKSILLYRPRKIVSFLCKIYYPVLASCANWKISGLWSFTVIVCSDHYLINISCRLMSTFQVGSPEERTM